MYEIQHYKHRKESSFQMHLSLGPQKRWPNNNFNYLTYLQHKIVTKDSIFIKPSDSD